MKEMRIFKAWQRRLVGDLTNSEDPIVQASIKQFEKITTTLEQTLLIAFLHDTGLKPAQIEMNYSHSPEGLTVCVRERQVAQAIKLPSSGATLNLPPEAIQAELEARGHA